MNIRMYSFPMPKKWEAQSLPLSTASSKEVPRSGMQATPSNDHVNPRYHQLANRHRNLLVQIQQLDEQAKIVPNDQREARKTHEQNYEQVYLAYISTLQRYRDDAVGHFADGLVAEAVDNSVVKAEMEHADAQAEKLYIHLGKRLVDAPWAWKVSTSRNFQTKLQRLHDHERSLLSSYQQTLQKLIVGVDQGRPITHHGQVFDPAPFFLNGGKNSDAVLDGDVGPIASSPRSVVSGSSTSTSQVHTWVPPTLLAVGGASLIIVALYAWHQSAKRHVCEQALKPVMLPRPSMPNSGQPSRWNAAGYPLVGTPAYTAGQVYSMQPFPGYMPLSYAYSPAATL